MEDHIYKHLGGFIQNPQDDFVRVYQHVQSEKKENSKALLVYISNLIDQTLSTTTLKFSHFHFEGFQEDLLLVVAEFISIKFFFLALNNEPGQAEEKITERISATEGLIKRLGTYPEGVKGGSRTDKQIRERRRRLKKRLSFYREIQQYNDAASLTPKTLINLSQKVNAHLEDLFFQAPFSSPVTEKQDHTYVLANDSLNRDEIDRLTTDSAKPLLNSVENIILIDCEQKKIYRLFQFNELVEWNKTGTGFKNLILFTFSDQFKLSGLHERIDRIRSRYYPISGSANDLSYTMLPTELAALLNRVTNKPIRPFFADESTSTFWEDFQQLLRRFEGLYELQSIKLCSIYSFALTKELSELILTDIFQSGQSEFISEETKETLTELSVESRKELAESLGNVLTYIEKSAWSALIRQNMSNASTIILPSPIANHNAFYNSLLKVLGPIAPGQFRTWHNIDFETKSEVLILDYRDSGPFPFRIKPNLQTATFPKSSKVTGIFLSFFFKPRYDWTSYSIERHLWTLLKHPVRTSNFGWGALKSKIDLQRPSYEDRVDWDQERSLSVASQVTSIRIKFKGVAKAKTYHLNDLFIAKLTDETRLRIMPLESIIEDQVEDSWMIQLLDELHSEFNIYERIANVAREKRELEVLRGKFDIRESTSPSSLWKELLKRQANGIGSNLAYEKLKKSLEEGGMGMVSKYTYEQSWTNPSSRALVPREKRVFSFICENLQVPKTYYRIMLRLKNAEKQRNRKSGQQMDRLLTDLVNDGCFNDSADVQMILTNQKAKYIQDHDLDEIGIPAEQFEKELSALVSLLQPNLGLKEVEKMETI